MQLMWPRAHAQRNVPPNVACSQLRAFPRKVPPVHLGQQGAGELHQGRVPMAHHHVPRGALPLVRGSCSCAAGTASLQQSASRAKPQLQCHSLATACLLPMVCSYVSHYKEMDYFMSVYEPLFYKAGADFVVSGHVSRSLALFLCSLARSGETRQRGARAHRRCCAWTDTLAVRPWSCLVLPCRCMPMSALVPCSITRPIHAAPSTSPLATAATWRATSGARWAACRAGLRATGFREALFFRASGPRASTPRQRAVCSRSHCRTHYRWWPQAVRG